MVSHLVQCKFKLPHLLQSVGTYTVLYILSIYILATHKQNNYWGYRMLITALYIAATIAIGLKFALHTTEATLNVASFTVDLPFFDLGQIDSFHPAQYRESLVRMRHELLEDSSGMRQ